MVAGATLVAAGCGSTSRNYSADEVKAAFVHTGITLASAMSARAPGKRFGGVLLSANLGSDFFVAVYDDERDAKASYAILRSQATRHSFDRLERNVVVSGQNLTSEERGKVVGALSQLSS
jgi:hypothetical protein